MNVPLRIAALVFAVQSAVGLTGCTSNDEQTLLTKAQEYRAKHDYKAAVIELKNVVSRNPENGQARYLLGVTYRDVGDMPSAEKEFRRAVELHYDPGRALPALGKALVTLGEYEKALEVMKTGSGADDRAQAQMLALRGIALGELGRKAEAQVALDGALARDPRCVDALLAQARLAALESRLDDARTHIERAVAADPANVDVWLMKGELERMLKQADAARKSYRKALEVNPDNVTALLALSLIAMDAGDFDEARKDVMHARKAQPGSPLPMYTLALLELRQHRYPQARDAVQAVLKVAPDHVPSLLVAGAAETALGGYAQAQSYLEPVVQSAPENVYARKLLATAMAKGGNPGGALHAVQEGLEHAPGNAELLALAGELSMQNRQYAQATRYFETAAKDKPDNAVIRTRLGASRLAEGHMDKALMDLDAAAAMQDAPYQADVMAVLSHLQRREYDQAEKAVRRLEAKQPKSGLTYNLRALIYAGKNDMANARLALERALEVQPGYLPAVMNLVRLDVKDGQPKTARGRLQALLDKNPNDTQALIAMAEVGPTFGATLKEQVEWLDRAAKAAPDSTQPRLALARVHARAGDVRSALDVLQQLQSRHPEDGQVLTALGTAQLEAGQKQQALSTFNRLVELQPNAPAALYRLGTAQLANGQSAAAAATLRKAVALQPKFVPAQAALAEAEAAAGNHAEAMKLVKKVQDQTPKSPAAHVLEADVWMAQHKPAQAAQAYEAAYALQPNAMVMQKLYGAYMRAGKPQQAEARLGQSLKDLPDDPALRMFAGEAYLSRSKYDRAAESYEWLLRKQPDNVIALNNLAWAYQQLGDRRAREVAEHAYKVQPGGGATADTLGWILVEQGETARGVELLKKAAAAAPNVPAIRLHLAQALAKAGDKSEARRELERLQSTDAKFAQQANVSKLLAALQE